MNKSPIINHKESDLPAFDDLQPIFDDQSHRLDAVLHQCRQPKRSPLWRYSAAASVVLIAVGALLLHKTTPTQQNNLVATHQTSQRHYAYSESSSGVRVYCQNGCNADEVMQQMMAALQTLD